MWDRLWNHTVGRVWKNVEKQHSRQTQQKSGLWGMPLVRTQKEVRKILLQAGEKGILVI